MGYIRFVVTRITDRNGYTTMSKVKRMESDLPSTSTLQPNIIYNALSFKGATKMFMALDEGVLNRDMLGGVDSLVLDTGILDCDLIR